MLSRVAETLYWTARYIERAENVARLVNVNNIMLMDLPKGLSPGWEPLIDIVGSRETYLEHHDDFSEKSVIAYLTVEKNNPSSIANSIKMARDNTRTIRDVVPKEMWEAINRLHLSLVDEHEMFLSKRGRFSCLKNVVAQCLQIFGTMEASMHRDTGYIFWKFGSYLERADMTSRIIDVRTAVQNRHENTAPFENIQWMSVLRSLSAYQMYRQHMAVRVKPQDVLLFMLHSEDFPRSVLYCLLRVRSLVTKLPNELEMKARIEHSIEELTAQDVASLKGQALHEYIDELQIDIADIHAQLAEQYFLHS